MRGIVCRFCESHFKVQNGTRHGSPATARSRALLSPPAQAGQDRGHADQAVDQPVRPVDGVLARGGFRLRGNRRRSGRSRHPDLARQSGRRHHQWHGRARPRRHRPARRQAGDGGQGRAVQEIRQHRCLRHRDRRTRSGQADRHHRLARTDLRRHQPRRHQGARMLLHREEAARAHEDSGLPRRPARHGDRRRRRGAQRAAPDRQGSENGQDRHLGRRRRGAGLPRPAGAARRPGREHLGHRHQRAGL